MKINTKISGKQLQALSKYGIAGFFWLGLIILLALELFVLIGSYRIVQRSQEIPTLTVTRQVRLDFKEYDKAVDRINGAGIYIPPERSDPSPFGD